MAWITFSDITHFRDPNDADPWKATRAENRLANLALTPTVLQPGEPTEEPCALVGFGASLARFGGHLKDYSTVFTTSRAHDYVVGQGVTPTHHVDTDAAPHKKGYITPQDATTYLLSLRCHPNYFEHLKNNKVVAFDHLSYSDEPEPSDYPVFPLTCHGGHTMILVAYFMGYRKFDFFGFDFNRENGLTTDMRYPSFQIEINGQTFETDKNLLAGAIIFYDVLQALQGIDVELYTDGLLRAYIEEKQTRSPDALARNRVEYNRD